jgi:hypothetical protein
VASAGVTRIVRGSAYPSEQGTRAVSHAQSETGEQDHLAGGPARVPRSNLTLVGIVLTTVLVVALRVPVPAVPDLPELPPMPGATS